MPGPGIAATFTQKLPDGKSHTRNVGLTPFLFDTSSPFDVEVAEGGGPVILAFQHQAIRTMSSKTAGRLKAMGCTLGDP